MSVKLNPGDQFHRPVPLLVDAITALTGIFENVRADSVSGFTSMYWLWNKMLIV